ncbi:hypothetical protein OROMI_011828 [Orobanche minor]
MSKSHSVCLPSSKIPSLLRKPTSIGFLRAKHLTFQRIPTKQPLYSSSAFSCHQSIEELPPKLREIVRLFQAVQDGCTKQKELLFYAYFDSDKNVIFEANYDAEIHKGLAALLVQGLSGQPVEEIIKDSLDFAVLLGLPGNRGSRIKEKLKSELTPIDLEVEDISYQHDGGTETHFNVKVVSEEFEGKSMVKRHRSIYGLLQNELQNKDCKHCPSWPRRHLKSLLP